MPLTLSAAWQQIESYNNNSHCRGWFYEICSSKHTFKRFRSFEAGSKIHCVYLSTDFQIFWDSLIKNSCRITRLYNCNYLPYYAMHGISTEEIFSLKFNAED